MKLVSYAQSMHDLNILKAEGCSEVIISSKTLNRYTKTSDSKLVELLSNAKNMDFKVVLEWDILATESEFSEFSNFFDAIDCESYDVIRVQDPGVLEYCLEHSSKKIQYIIENGNHNLLGIQTWVNYIGERLDRIVLSVELNKDKLKEYISALKCECEILGLGRILLFYSPRKLLSTLTPEDDEKKEKGVLSDDFIEALGESEESPHKGFPLVENRHGTFMFHIKDLNLLDHANELVDIGLQYIRVDLRFEESLDLIPIVQKHLESNDQKTEIKEAYSQPVIKGYYNINKSDVLFKKLKNYRIQRKDELYIGEVMEALKGEYLAIQLRSDLSLKVNDDIKLVTPEGKEVFCKVHTLRSSDMNDCGIISKKGSLAFINYMSGIWSKSQVYLK